MARPALTVFAVCVAGAAVTLAGVFASVQYVQAARVESVSPAPGAAVPESAPTLTVRVANPGQVSSISLKIDGQPVGASLKPTAGGFAATLPGLADGTHRAVLVTTTSGMFGSTSRRAWTFTVDTTPPALSVSTPESAWLTKPLLQGAAEPGAVVTARWQGGSVRTIAGADGAFALHTRSLPQGETPVTVAATDMAGNQTSAARLVKLDTIAPRLSLQEPRWVKTAAPKLSGTLKDGSPTKLTVTVDGKPGGSTSADSGAIAAPLPTLSQGLHTAVVTATDAAGHVTTRTWRFGVDSTEKLSSDVMISFGARGKDVRQLSKRLKAAGDWKGPLTDRFDHRMQAAVKSFESANGLTVDGVAGPQLIAATTGKLVVIEHLFRVFFYRDGKLVVSFPVAVGMPQYPSPVGTYRVMDKVMNPTWVPPNSPWAAGLEPIPPGVNNPLGPRWIGTSAPNVGFHGTNEPSSIGHAMSHGCIRMYPADVIKLYPLVEVGMPVVFER